MRAVFMLFVAVVSSASSPSTWDCRQLHHFCRHPKIVVFAGQTYCKDQLVINWIPSELSARKFPHELIFRQLVLPGQSLYKKNVIHRKLLILIYLLTPYRRLSTQLKTIVGAS